MVPRIALLAHLALVATLALPGCGWFGPTGTLSGRLTYKGQPVHHEARLFLVDAGVVVQAKLHADGTFEFVDEIGRPRPISVGKYALALAPPHPKSLSSEEQQALMEAGQPIPDVVRVDFPVPEEYHSTATSPGRVTVDEGPNVRDIDLD